MSATKLKVLWYLILCLFFLSSFTTKKAPDPETQGYQYVRLVIEQNTNGVHIWELEWLNGAVAYPKIPFTSNTGTFEAKFEGSYNNPNVFDKTNASGYVNQTPSGESPITINFKNHVIYPTGVRITKPGWSYMHSFRVEASNDPAGTWDILYESPDEVGTLFNGTIGEFNFGFDPVPVDETPPPAPQLIEDVVTHNSFTVSWPEVLDGESSIAGYEIFLDGVAQGFTSNNNFLVEFLESSTEYKVEVIAYDSEYNASSKAEINITTTPPPVAEAFEYLRFWVMKTPNSGKFQLVGLKWLMGDKKLPLEAIISAAGNEDIEILSSNDNIYAFDGPYKSFDEIDNTHWYVDEGKEMTLHFKNFAVYPTGVEITSYSWAALNGFRCEGSNDGENWTELYNRDGLSSSDYPTVENGVRRGIFEFGTILPPDLDVTAPSVPTGINVDEITSTSAQISWVPSTDEGVGVSGYTVFVNGEEWENTKSPEVTIYGLSPSTAYEITINASDILGNVSTTSAPFQLSTNSLAPSLGKMTIGAGLGSYTTGIWKNGVDFAAEWADYENANPFNPVFIDEISHYKVLRFMDMLPTNNNWIENWSDRRQPDDPDQAVNQNYNKDNQIIVKGVAIEWWIKLCNLTGADLWINIPHAANDDYIQQLASTIKAHLDPSLKVFVEYSNEVWGGFGAEVYATQQGQALGFDQGDFERYAWFGDEWYARFRFYVHRAVQIYGIFGNVYQGHSGDFVKVLSGWHGQPDVTQIHLDALGEELINPNGIYPDVYAIAPYFAGSLSGANPDFEEQVLSSTDESVDKVKRHYAILSSSGMNIPLVAYEAGQHITNAGEIANRRPVIYEAYMNYLNALSPYMDILPQFVHLAPYARGMAWGAKEYVGQPELTAYKYRALKDWQAINEGNQPIEAPLIMDQPEDVSIAEGSGANFSLSVIGFQPMSFQWFEDGVLLDGETAATLALPQVTADKNGKQYTVKITSPYGEITSEPATLSVEAVDKAIVNKTNAALTIDGTADATWENASQYPLGKISLGTVDGAEDASGYFKALWDDNYLYILVNITDNALVPVEDETKIWNYDGVEVYLDITNDKTTSYNTNDRQFVFTYQGELVGASGLMSYENAQAAQTITTSGYQTEFAFAWSDMGLTPNTGHYLGIEVMAADNDTQGGNREGKIAWWGTQDNAWENPSLFGTAYLEGLTTVESLNLTSECSEDPRKTRNWRVTNPNAFDVNYSYEVVGTNQTEMLVATPGLSYFTTEAIAGANTTKIYWENENGEEQSKTKASGGAYCEPVASFPITNGGTCEIEKSTFPEDLWTVVASAPADYADFSRSNGNYVVGVIAGNRKDGKPGAWEIHNDCTIHPLRQGAAKNSSELPNNSHSGLKYHHNWKFVVTDISADGGTVYADAINELGFEITGGQCLAAGAPDVEPGTVVPVSWSLSSRPFYGRIKGAHLGYECEVEIYNCSNGYITGCVNPNARKAATDMVENLFSEQPEIMIYPSPTNGPVNITFTGKLNGIDKAEILIYDFSGKVVNTLMILSPENKEYRLDLDKFANGLYLVKAVYGTYSKSLKIVKE
ncbi:sugar-binding protein [Flexithrix dorotheae]|uniref:sugar-binding protein n=1 Tax=Flexithrix dorotheae TaxID=70993 RepID=UPI000376307E|nr:sugar-binding protein [Flexithrix dorotheae]